MFNFFVILFFINKKTNLVFSLFISLFLFVLNELIFFNLNKVNYIVDVVIPPFFFSLTIC